MSDVLNFTMSNSDQYCSEQIVTAVANLWLKLWKGNFSQDENNRSTLKIQINDWDEKLAVSGWLG